MKSRSPHKREPGVKSKRETSVSPVAKSVKPKRPHLDAEREKTTTLTAVPKKVRGKPRAKRDGAWNKKREKKRGRKTQPTETRPSFLRTDNSKTFINSAQEEIAVKASVVVEYETIEHPNKENIAPDFSKIEHYRPLASIKRDAITGSPIGGNTPGGDELRVVLRVKPVYFLSNNTNIPQAQNASQIITRLPEGSKFHETEAYLAVKKWFEPFKYQEAHVDSTLLKQTRREKDIAQSQRPGPGQGACMAAEGYKAKDARATLYAREMKVFPDMKWEWFHLIANQIAGVLTQQDSNLIAASFHANTNASFIEDNIPYLASVYPEGFKLEVQANLIPGTVTGTFIDFAILLPDGVRVPLQINAQEPNAPHKSFKEMFNVWLKEMVRAAKTSPRSTPVATTPTTSTTSTSQRTTPESLYGSPKGKKGRANVIKALFFAADDQREKPEDSPVDDTQLKKKN